MSNKVFANGREISCKQADGKTICEFPDVCFTPPQTPATPPGVPIPYPNTAMASDTTDGSKTVQVSGQEVMLKNKSYFKKSTGDEAGSAPKKGMISSTNKGKAYFISWSMDVKVEGENVVRHLDMTTHNHASPMATGAAPMAYQDTAALSKADKEACDHPNDKEKKTHVYVVYMAFAKDGSGKIYIGRTGGPGTAEQALAKRKAGHHRKDIGDLIPVCETYSYAAVRGAEQAHMDAVPANKKILKKGKPQIRAISPRHKNKKNYEKCAKAVGKSKSPPCPICGA